MNATVTNNVDFQQRFLFQKLTQKQFQLKVSFKNTMVKSPKPPGFRSYFQLRNNTLNGR